MSKPTNEIPTLDGVEYTKNEYGRIVSVAVDLFFPLEDSGISKLKLRRMKAKDTLVAEDTDDKTKAGYALYARLASIDPKLFYEIDIEDVERIAEALIPLMGKSAQHLATEAMANLSSGET